MKDAFSLRGLLGQGTRLWTPRRPQSRRGVLKRQRRIVSVERLETRCLLHATALVESPLQALPVLEPLEASSANVLISEIMYHPLEDDPRDEYLELFNPTQQSIRLGGWQLTRGVDFVFPDYELPGNGCVVVAADRERFALLHSGISQVVGDWTG